MAFAHRHARWSADHDLFGTQKIHVEAAPPVGDVGICAGSASTMWLDPEFRMRMPSSMACFLPVFLSGLLGVLLLDGVVARTGWLAFDHLPAVNGLLWLGCAGAVFAVTGVSTSTSSTA